jgi:hypothetical protein
VIALCRGDNIDRWLYWLGLWLSMGREVSDAALIERQRALQREAAAFMSDLRIEQTLSRLGPVLGVGSAFTGMMVWRDLDLVVDAGDATASVAFEAMQPLLGCCREARYEHTLDPRRHYFVLHIPWRRELEWKLDVSAFLGGTPPEVDAFQNELRRRLDDDTRLLVLRLKDAWYRHPAYPGIVGGYEIYDAVLHHDTKTLADLDRYLAARGMPTLAA